jgi:two-component system nitrate/nitrite response regulator NarL
LLVLADGVTIFRSGVRSVLQRDGGFDVVEVGDANGLLRVAAERRPFAVLVDWQLPPGGAQSVLPELAPELPVVVWSSDPDPESIAEAVRAGASGFLSKQISADGLIRALRGIPRGEAPLSRDLTRMLIETVRTRGEADVVPGRLTLLSQREREVLSLVAQGANNRDIAQDLSISQFTAKRHVQNILMKLNLPSRAAAAAVYGRSFADQGEVESA